MSSLVRPLNRIKLRGEVFGVYSKVYTLCYSQNGKTERLQLKNAILLNETYQWVIYTHSIPSALWLMSALGTVG